MTTALEKASAEFNGLAKAAAGVIAQLREEMSGLDERDNVALHERKLLLEQLRELLQTVNAASEQQRAGTEALLASASSALAQAGMRFAGLLEAQSTQAADTAAHIAAGAVELAAVAEAFAQGVQQFQTGNDKLVESLERMEASLRRSTARSDEQLAYYVAQAREVIDLSIASQQGLVENLRALHVAPIKTRPAQGERA
jgi:methyl-accepting chemotaxis protein